MSLENRMLMGVEKEETEESNDRVKETNSSSFLSLRGETGR